MDADKQAIYRYYVPVPERLQGWRVLLHQPVRVVGCRVAVLRQGPPGPGTWPALTLNSLGLGEAPAASAVNEQIQSAITGTLSPQGIVVPASALQQGNVTMATVAGGTVYQPVTVVTPQGQVVTQALSPGTIRIQNSQNPRVTCSAVAGGESPSADRPCGGPVPRHDLGPRSGSSVTCHCGRLDLTTCLPLRAVVTITTPVSMNVDSLQSLSSDGATLAVQQVMMAEQSEDESVDSTGDGTAALAPGHIGGLVLENSDSLQ
ncbi:hypothetical protein CB1_000197035 [Camelus ferus]|nr:hypothetical protein CB1_000197035 [Camelus ferus]